VSLFFIRRKRKQATKQAERNTPHESPVSQLREDWKSLLCNFLVSTLNILPSRTITLRISPTVLPLFPLSLPTLLPEPSSVPKQPEHTPEIRKTGRCCSPQLAETELGLICNMP